MTCATKAKIAGICGSSHDPGGFALLVELTAGTVMLVHVRFDKKAFSALLCSLVQHTIPCVLIIFHPQLHTSQ